MRRYELAYAEALDLVKKQRPCVMPNKGFEEQLRIWERCEYDLHHGDGTEKKDYLEWKRREKEKPAAAVNRKVLAEYRRDMAVSSSRKRSRSLR